MLYKLQREGHGSHENVHAAANFVNKTNTEEVTQLIREAGFVPAQRTTLYEIVRTYGPVEVA